MSKIFKRTLPLLLFAIMCPAQAIELGTIVSTYHFKRRMPDTGQRWNERNGGLLLETDGGLTLGTYKNSLWTETNFIGYAYRPIHILHDRVQVGGLVGYASGYPIPALAALSVKVRVTDVVGLTFVVSPTVGKYSGSASVIFTFKTW